MQWWQVGRRGMTAGVIALLIAPAEVVQAHPAPIVATSPDPVCAARIALPERGSLWAPPLDRIITGQLPELPLRDALDRLAAMAHLELSYSADLLPAGRRVCLALERVPVGAVLESLLAGTSLRSIVLGASQVVLAPSRRDGGSAGVSGAPVMARHASVLDRVVVTGSPDGAPERGSPFALDVIEGALSGMPGGVRGL